METTVVAESGTGGSDRSSSEGEVLLLRLDEGKANAIGPALTGALQAELEQIEARCPRALIITGAGRHFSAGLHLADLSVLDRPGMEAFVESFERVFLTLFELPFPVVAAINGNAVAGGAVMGACCDFRVAVDSGPRIGLNEVQVGVSLPSIALESLRCLLAPASLRSAVLAGQLHTPEDALALGLVDELVGQSELLPRATSIAEQLAAAPTAAFAQVKNELREPFADRVRSAGGASRRAFVDLWFREEAKALRARFL